MDEATAVGHGLGGLFGAGGGGAGLGIVGTIVAARLFGIKPGGNDSEANTGIRKLDDLLKVNHDMAENISGMRGDIRELLGYLKASKG